MIIIVDEDINQLRAFESELVIRGHEALLISDADQAYEQITTMPPDQIQLVVIDVMLATQDSGHSRFDRARTDDFLTTGLALIEDLLDSPGPHLTSDKFMINSCAREVKLTTRINNFGLKHGIPYVQKGDFLSPKAWVDHLEEILKGDNP